MAHDGGARGAGLRNLERLLNERTGKIIDLSDSFYLMISPTSADFEAFLRLIGDDLRMIRYAILIEDGIIGSGLEEFEKKLELIAPGSVVREELPSLDQLTVISSLTELARKVKELNRYGERRLRILVLCSGYLKIPLFHLSLYLNARAVELDDSSYRELIAYPVWRLNEMSLAVLYVVSRMEEAGIPAFPQNIIKYVKIRSKDRMRRSGGDDERSKIVSLDYHVRRYFDDGELLVKEKGFDMKRGVYYKLTPLGRKVAKLVEAHLLSVGSELSEYVDLEVLESDLSRS